MSDKQLYLITVRFAPWGYDDTKPRGGDEYSAFGVRYLIELPTGSDVLKEFKKIYKEKINNNKPFDGEILFIEEQNIVIL